MTEIDQYVQAIEEFPAYVKDAILAATTDGERVDVLSAVKHCEQSFGQQRRGVEAELDYGTTAGSQAQVKIPRKADRSYNTSALLLAFMEASEQDIIRTLLWLRNEGVLTFSWNWRPLQAAAEKYLEGLRIAKREIEDGDPDWDVGEVWSNASATYSPVE